MGKALNRGAIWMVVQKAATIDHEAALAKKLSPQVSRFGLQEALDYLEKVKHSAPEFILLQGRPGKESQQMLAALHEKAPSAKVFLLSSWQSAEEMSEWVSKLVIQAVQPQRSFSADMSTENPYQLSRRETEVLDLMTKGLIKKEIAEQLSISYHTIVHHERSIYEKLNVHTRSAAVAKALMEKLC